MISPEKMQSILEAALMVAGEPLTIHVLQNLFPENNRPSSSEIKALLGNISQRHEESGIELKEVASGFRLQAKAELSPWLAKLWEGRTPRYSRAFLETVSIIAYKQPITRAEIEDIRGVTVSSQIIKALLEREWIQVLGYRDLPGKPAILGTTKAFLDHFNLKSLSDLPPLAEFRNLEAQEAELQVQLSIEPNETNPAKPDEANNETESTT